MQIFEVGVVHTGPHPGHLHLTTDGDLVLPVPGPAGRRGHARQLRPGQAITAIAGLGPTGIGAAELSRGARRMP